MKHKNGHVAQNGMNPKWNGHVVQNGQHYCLLMITKWNGHVAQNGLH